MNILELMTWPVNKYRIWCWKYLGIALCSPRDNPVHLIRWSTKSSALEVHELQCIIQELSCSFFFFFQPQLTGTILWVTSVLRIWTTTLFSLGGGVGRLTRTAFCEWWKLIDQSISTTNITVVPYWDRHGVFGSIERETGQCLLQKVPNRAASTLQVLVVCWILPGTRTISLGWATYSGSGQFGHEYQHDTDVCTEFCWPCWGNTPHKQYYW